MPKFYVYADEAAFAADKWSTGSYLGLALTKANAEKAGHLVILQLHSGKVYRFVDGKWKA